MSWDMPRIYGISNPKSGKIRVFYTVDQSVGRGGTNARLDAMLVQFFLRILCDEVKKPSPISLASSVKRPLKIDGIWGSTSQAYLDAWEKMISATFGGVLMDGKVSTMSSGTTAGSTTGSRYKMAVLNGNYGMYRNNDWHLNLTSDPLWPAELTGSLYVTTTI